MFPAHYSLTILPNYKLYQIQAYLLLEVAEV